MYYLTKPNKSFKIYKVARPRFELGSKAPKNSNVIFNSVLDKQAHDKYPEDFWIRFKSYLKGINQSENNIQNKVNYAKKYYYILETGNAEELLSSSFKVRNHTMKALSSLLKYQGKYDE